MPFETREQRSLMSHILECLVAATRDEKSARLTHEAFSALPEDETLGGELAKLFGGQWSLSDQQTNLLAGWPTQQLRLARSAIIQAAEARMAGDPIYPCVSGVVGQPHSITVRVSGTGQFEVTFVSPEIA